MNCDWAENLELLLSLWIISTFWWQGKHAKLSSQTFDKNSNNCTTAAIYVHTAGLPCYLKILRFAFFPPLPESVSGFPPAAYLQGVRTWFAFWIGAGVRRQRIPQGRRGGSSCPALWADFIFFSSARIEFLPLPGPVQLSPRSVLMSSCLNWGRKLFPSFTKRQLLAGSSGWRRQGARGQKLPRFAT